MTLRPSMRPVVSSSERSAAELLSDSCCVVNGFAAGVDDDEDDDAILRLGGAIGSGTRTRDIGVDVVGSGADDGGCPGHIVGTNGFPFFAVESPVNKG